MQFSLQVSVNVSPVTMGQLEYLEIHSNGPVRLTFHAALQSLQLKMLRIRQKGGELLLSHLAADNFMSEKSSCCLDLSGFPEGQVKQLEDRRVTGAACDLASAGEEDCSRLLDMLLGKNECKYDLRSLAGSDDPLARVLAADHSLGSISRIYSDFLEQSSKSQVPTIGN